MRSSRRSARIAFGFACFVQVLVAAAYYRLTDGCFCVVDGVGPAVAWAPALTWVVRIGAYPLSLLPMRLYDPGGARTPYRVATPLVSGLAISDRGVAHQSSVVEHGFPRVNGGDLPVSFMVHGAPVGIATCCLTNAEAVKGFIDLFAAPPKTLMCPFAA
jgi:hypothetical protein